MNDKTFFKPTSLYKEYMILNFIENNRCITQREMAKHVGISLSMINIFLDDYETKGLIKRQKHTRKTIEYKLTQNGIERRKLLNMYYLKSSLLLYEKAKESVEKFLIEIENKGNKNIYLYGAGEVAEIFIDTINNSENISMKMMGIVDDDINKIGSYLHFIPIISLTDFIQKYNGGILISSHTNKDNMLKRLKEKNYDFNKIYNYFD